MSLVNKALWFVLGLVVGWLASAIVIPRILGFIPFPQFLWLLQIALELLVAYILYKWHRPMFWGYLVFFLWTILGRYVRLPF